MAVWFGVISAARYASRTSNRRLRGARVATALLLVNGAVAPAILSGQVLVGRALEEGRNVPVAGATVSLVGRDGRFWATVVSDSLGRFQLVPPRAGEFYVEATRLGYERARSPLLALGVEGRVAIELLMDPVPIGLEGIEVSVEREARELLGQYGLTPRALGARWIDRTRIERMQLPGGAKEVIRWQSIPGVWVEENDRPGRPGEHFDRELCVRIRGSGCALIVLNGVMLNHMIANDFLQNTQEFEAIAILRPSEAATLFGTQAHGGAVMIWTRQGRR